MSQLNVVATIVAKAGAEQRVEDALKALIAPTLTEAGCLQYDLHRDVDKPGVFVFYETWTNRELLAAHLQSAHLVTYQQVVDGLVEAWDMKLMTRIGV
ncbi:putative quinol monooxygenase [Chitinivorax sp. B]|uniref:putative quinol monooxygenase n=1 Tax=Chitinivorax sp. B TaxID=2502235 RepID=UPI0010F45DC9|nr:putative quinol monooxygenase [Chitinivorax sp. B]